MTELETLRAALAETRDALQKALGFHQTTHIHAILREALARVETPGASDALVTAASVRANVTAFASGGIGTADDENDDESANDYV